MNALLQKLTALWTAIVVFFAGITGYYLAQDTTDAMTSDLSVAVVQVRQGYLFDGPGEADALIFYPGAKVQETAYAPLLHALAAQGVDCYLMKMPLDLAIFGVNKAQRVMEQGSYERYFLAGHSLGGAMAAQFASSHPDAVSGLILLAAYTVKDLTKAGFPILFIYGSEDGVLNRSKFVDGYELVPQESRTLVIDGGNHAQFGAYGSQKKDGTATISAEEQQRITAEAILDLIHS